MLTALTGVFSFFGSVLNSVLSVEIPYADGESVSVRSIFLFIFIIYMFIKFFAVVTHNQSVTRKE